MSRSLLKILFCVCFSGWMLYSYIHRHNDLMVLRLKIPTLEKELKILQEENRHLQYEIDHFESPIHLMELARKPEFSHLKHPYLEDILIVKKTSSEEKQEK